MVFGRSLGACIYVCVRSGLVVRCEEFVCLLTHPQMNIALAMCVCCETLMSDPAGNTIDSSTPIPLLLRKCVILDHPAHLFFEEYGFFFVSGGPGSGFAPFNPQCCGYQSVRDQVAINCSDSHLLEVLGCPHLLARPGACCAISKTKYACPHFVLPHPPSSGEYLHHRGLEKCVPICSCQGPGQAMRELCAHDSTYLRAHLLCLELSE